MVMYDNNPANPTLKLQAPNNMIISERELTFQTDISDLGVTSGNGNGNGIPIPPPPKLQQFASPLDWPQKRKTLMTALSCAVTVLAGYGAGAYSPPQVELTKTWRVSETVYNLGITAYTLGFAFAPMVLSPFSEVVGRRPVFLTSGLLFTVCQIGCGVTTSFGGMFTARFFLGVFGSTFTTMIGGVLSDIYIPEERNTPMAIFSGAAFVGTGLGPLVSGFIAQNSSWRWIYFCQAILSAIVVLLVAVFFMETRGNVLLRRKASVLNNYYEAIELAGYHIVAVSEKRDPTTKERFRWKVKEDDERETLGKTIAVSLIRPFHLLFTEPVVFMFSLWISFSYAILYLQFDSILLVYQSQYNFSVQQSCAVFAAMSIGSIFATLLSIWQDRFTTKYLKGPLTPERRLYFASIEASLLPIGLFWFGWTARPSIHWIIPTFAVGCSTIGIYSIYLAVHNYLADTYGPYTSSALAAASFCRNVVGGIFPLVTKMMFENLGIPNASSLLGGLGFLLTLVPWVLIFFGPRIRSRSAIAKKI